jgi:hypothetical protein
MRRGMTARLVRGVHNALIRPRGRQANCERVYVRLGGYDKFRYL